MQVERWARRLTPLRLLIAAVILVDARALGSYEVSIRSVGCDVGPWRVPQCQVVSTTLATSKVASHIDQLASSLTMFVRFIAPHYQLLCPGAEPRKWHHVKVVLGGRRLCGDARFHVFPGPQAALCAAGLSTHAAPAHGKKWPRCCLCRVMHAMDSRRTLPLSGLRRRRRVWSS